MHSGEASTTSALVSEIRKHMTRAPKTGIHHARCYFTTGAIEPWRAKTLSVASFINTRATVVTALISTVINGYLAVSTCKLKQIKETLDTYYIQNFKSIRCLIYTKLPMKKEILILLSLLFEVTVVKVLLQVAPKST